MNEETQINRNNLMPTSDSSIQDLSSTQNSEALQTINVRNRNENFSDDITQGATDSSNSTNNFIDTSRSFFAQNTTDEDGIATPANYNPPNYISDNITENEIVPYTPRPPSGPPPAYSPPADGHGLPIPPPYSQEDVPVSTQVIPTRHQVVRFYCAIYNVLIKFAFSTYFKLT